MAFDPKTELNTLSDLLQYTLRIYQEHYCSILLASLVISTIVFFLKSFLLENIYFLFGILLLMLLCYLVFTSTISWITEASLVDRQDVIFRLAVKNAVNNWMTLIFTYVYLFARVILMSLFVSFLPIYLVSPIAEYFNIEVDNVEMLPYFWGPIILIYGTYFHFTTQFVSLRQRKNVNGIQQSRNIVQGQWLKVNGLSLLILLTIFVPYVLLIFVFRSIGTDFEFILWGVLMVILPIFPIFRTLLFLNLEARQGMTPETVAADAGGSEQPA